MTDRPAISEAQAGDRKPYHPTKDEWGQIWGMLCAFCAHTVDCKVVDGMIDMKHGGPWPAGGWVTDPGAQVTCLSYTPRRGPPIKREQLRRILRMPESDLPPVCGGCAARKGSEASVSLHTRRDYSAAVVTGTMFVCHEDPEKKRLCGGLCRSLRRRAA